MPVIVQNLCTLCLVGQIFLCSKSHHSKLTGAVSSSVQQLLKLPVGYVSVLVETETAANTGSASSIGSGGACVAAA